MSGAWFSICVDSFLFSMKTGTWVKENGATIADSERMELQIILKSMLSKAKCYHLTQKGFPFHFVVLCQWPSLQHVDHFPLQHGGQISGNSSKQQTIARARSSTHSRPDSSSRFWFRAIQSTVFRLYHRSIKCNVHPERERLSQCGWLCLMQSEPTWQQRQNASLLCSSPTCQKWCTPTGFSCSCWSITKSYKCRWKGTGALYCNSCY